MNDINHIPLIDVNEEVRLASLIAQGCGQARDKLIRSNLRLVVKIAHDFKNLGLPFEDLVSEGNIGLIRAAEKFDPEKGSKFSSYASWWIKQAMRRALSEKSKTIRIPVASVNKILKIKKIRQQLLRDLDREPTIEEISNETGLSCRVVKRLIKIDMNTLSLNDPILSGEEGEMSKLIPDHSVKTPNKNLETIESAKYLRELMEILNERERNILIMRYGLDGSDPQTLDEISKKIGRTRERVRQIQTKAISKLKKHKQLKLCF